MIIKSVKLNNIRSYADATINLPDGSVLLAGDIGAGKTTILLAIDFALFGVRRGELSGAALLRHGTDEGSVELAMEMDGKDIIIGRTLRRKRGGEDEDTVMQDSGYMEIDGRREELSIIEMQSAIMEMLNYPIEFVKKSKSLIYRYTVYTPQEAMKQILLTGADERLTILRKIFDVDKYKVISANAIEIAKQLRADTREIAGEIADIDKKKSELELQQKFLETLEESATGVAKKLAESRKRLDGKKKEKERLSKAAENMNALKRMVASNEAELKASKQQVVRIINELLALEKELMSLPKAKIDKLAAKAPAMSAVQIDAELVKLEKEKEGLLNERTATATDIERWNAILKRGVCNTCGQHVMDREKFKNRITAMGIELKDIEERLANRTKQMQELAKMRDEIYTYLRELQEKKNMLAQLSRIERNRKELIDEKAMLDKYIVELEKTVAENKGKIDETIAEKMAAIEKEMDIVLAEQMKTEKEHSRLEQQINDCRNAIMSLKKEIDEKEKKKQMIDTIRSKENWLSNLFAPLMTTIERNVMSQIRAEFNALFQKWFDMLIDNEEMNGRVDGDFNAIVEQNGYETEYANLSGGERTSVALAYRLALNAVINKIVEHIKTKGLLILDEPTDGFSTDQLEKVRDVLSELHLKQIIIVSHEPKIETFVDKVIRFSKEGGTTRVIP